MSSGSIRVTVDFILRLGRFLPAGLHLRLTRTLIYQGNFRADLDELKHGDVTPIHKKKAKSDKTNNRPVSILPKISKISEKLIYNQFYDYFDDILSLSQCSFRKGHSMYHCLLAMLEKFKESEDQGNEFGALLTYL